MDGVKCVPEFSYGLSNQYPHCKKIDDSYTSPTWICNECKAKTIERVPAVAVNGVTVVKTQARRDQEVPLVLKNGHWYLRTERR